MVFFFFFFFSKLSCGSPGFTAHVGISAARRSNSTARKNAHATRQDIRKVLHIVLALRKGLFTEREKEKSRPVLDETGIHNLSLSVRDAGQIFGQSFLET